MSDEGLRVVRLRDGEDGRHLMAYIDEAGSLHIDGHDLGGDTFVVSPSGEYEWFTEVAAADVDRVVELLDGEPGKDVLDLLERHWVGPVRSGEFEARLRESAIPVSRFVR